MQQAELNVEERTLLRQFMSEFFSLDELKEIAFDLHGDYELFRHETKSQLAVDLIMFCTRRRQLPTLINLVKIRYPNADLEKILVKLPLARSYKKVEIFVDDDLKGEFERFINQLVEKGKLSREEISLMGIAAGSARLLISIPEKNNSLLLSLKWADFDVSVNHFVQLDTLSKYTWHQIVKFHPPVTINSSIEPAITWTKAMEKTRKERYVGTLVGESTSREFRLALAHEAVREQDIIAVDAELRHPDENKPIERVRVWAKVQRIERLNPLFPSEAGHELAATRTDPFDTVLSLSREMVTAVCQVLGAEPIDGSAGGKLDHLRYPPQPASSAYRPDSSDIARVVLGELQDHQNRALDLATLSNRPEVDVKVDGHAIVSRHLAILAMTGAGKSVTARRIIEQLSRKNYPIVIFDPHGDYTGLSEVQGLKVKRYYAQFPIFEEDAETVAEIINTLGYKLTDTMRSRFGDLFHAATSFIIDDKEEMQERETWLSEAIKNPQISTYGVRRDMWLIANLAEAGELAIRNENNNENKAKLLDFGWTGFDKYTKTDGRTLEGIKKRAYRTASALNRMEKTNKIVAKSAEPLPVDRKELVQYGQISVIALAGYTSDFQATIYSLIADSIFESRITGDLKLPTLLLLEEAHNFAPARATTPAELRAISTTKQIAQEGRKFGVGLILVSQRPSRLDETTLSQANSFIIMRMVNPADQNFVRKVIETLGEEDARMLPDLDVGEAILSGQLINFPVLVRIKKSESEGEREEKDAFEELERANRSLEGR